jgi:hypothetical protein
MPSRSDRALLIALAAYVALLAALPLLLPAPTLKRVLSESGPFEVGALLMWLAAAAALAVRIRPFTARTLAFTTLMLLFAAREADLQKAFTAESISRLHYYRRVAAPLSEKLAAAAVALLFLALVAYAVFVCLRFLARGGLKSRAGMWLALAGVLLVATKLVDRTQAVLAGLFGIAVPPGSGQFMAAFEEGIEAVVPLLFAVSAWISQVERRYLS